MEQFTSPQHAKEVSNAKYGENEQLIETVLIEGTPFTALRNRDDWYLCLGKYRLNNPAFESLEEVKKDATDASWFRIMQIMSIVVQEYIEDGELDKRIKGQIDKLNPKDQLKIQLDQTIEQQKSTL